MRPDRGGLGRLVHRVVLYFLAIAALGAAVAVAVAVASVSEGHRSAPATAAVANHDVLSSTDLAAACPTLTARDFADEVTSPAILETAKVSTVAGSQYCEVTGYVAPQIQFQIQLPLSGWNGNELFVGCGGFCGQVAISVAHAGNTSNYAVIAENEGHIAASEIDALWAKGNFVGQVDWGSLGVHAVKIAADRVIASFYGSGPHYSLFDGCSDGGREGLVEAQKFPADFNGILAGDPNWLQNYLAAIAQSWVARINTARDGSQILPSSKLGMVATAAYNACAGPNGLIENPASCKFDPATLQCAAGDQPTCLTPAQVVVVKEMYAGPFNSHGQSLYPGGGLAIGSEGGWNGLDVSPNPSALPGAGAFATQYLKYLAFLRDPPPNYSIFDFNYDRDVPAIVPKGAVFNADNPNLMTFERDGGKLILYHGASDPLIATYGSVYYYNEVVNVMGGLGATQKFFRFYEVPGMYHCAGGPGVSNFDALTPLVNWVENGTAPTEIDASHTDSAGNPTITLPLVPYPDTAKWDGQGSPTDGSNWVEVPGTALNGNYCWIGNTGRQASGCIPPPGFSQLPTRSHRRS